MSTAAKVSPNVVTVIAAPGRVLVNMSETYLRIFASRVDVFSGRTVTDRTRGESRAVVIRNFPCTVFAEIFVHSRGNAKATLPIFVTLSRVNPYALDVFNTSTP